jgi:hypothetical protein
MLFIMADTDLERLLKRLAEDALLVEAVRELTVEEQLTLVESVRVANLPDDATQDQIWEVIPPEIQKTLEEERIRQSVLDIQELLSRAIERLEEPTE